MDVLTILMSAIVAIPIQFFVMFLVYSKWILPAINKMIAAIPSMVRENTAPYIDEKIGELSRSVKASSARFQRTVNQAVDSLDIGDIDLSTEEGIRTAQDTLTKRYGVDVAIQAIGQLIQSIEGRKKAETTKEGVVTW